MDTAPSSRFTYDAQMLLQHLSTILWTEISAVQIEAGKRMAQTEEKLAATRTATRKPKGHLARVALNMNGTGDLLAEHSKHAHEASMLYNAVQLLLGSKERMPDPLTRDAFVMLMDYKNAFPEPWRSWNGYAQVGAFVESYRDTISHRYSELTGRNLAGDMVKTKGAGAGWTVSA